MGYIFRKIVETLLHLLLRGQKKQGLLAPLPTFSSGILVDIAGRDALYRAMEGR